MPLRLRADTALAATRVRIAVVAGACLGAALLAVPAAAAGEPQVVVGPSPNGSWVARIVVPSPGRAAPHKPKLVAHVATRAAWGGGPVQLLVLDAYDERRPPERGGDRLWIKVALPRRPNGSAAWILADHAKLHFTRWRIELSTVKRRMVVLRGTHVVRSFKVVVGAPGTPTPHGLFAIAEQIEQASPNGFLGPWALHLTAFSSVLDNYGGGPGRVAIHGRGGASLFDPLGTARSHGCIRIDNRQVRWLARTVQLGTPVHITY